MKRKKPARQILTCTLQPAQGLRGLVNALLAVRELGMTYDRQRDNWKDRSQHMQEAVKRILEPDATDTEVRDACIAFVTLWNVEVGPSDFGPEHVDDLIRWRREWDEKES